MGEAVETKDQRREPNMGANRDGLTVAQQMALDLTADQPAAKFKWCSLMDFAMDPPLTDEEFNVFMAALAELSANEASANDPFKD
jgi:hypothetical protein